MLAAVRAAVLTTVVGVSCGLCRCQARTLLRLRLVCSCGSFDGAAWQGRQLHALWQPLPIRTPLVCPSVSCMPNDEMRNDMPHTFISLVSQAHSLSLADSMMSDADGPHGLMGSAMSHPHFAQSHNSHQAPHQYSQQLHHHPRGHPDLGRGQVPGDTGLTGEYGALAAGLHIPSSSLADSLSEDLFFDARSVASSNAHSLAASTVSVMGGHMGGGPHGGSSMHHHPAAAGGYSPNIDRTHAAMGQLPPSQPAPTYKITATGQELCVVLHYSTAVLSVSTNCTLSPGTAPTDAFGSSAQQQQQQGQQQRSAQQGATQFQLPPSLVLSCSDARVCMASGPKGRDVSLSLFGVMAHELLPASQPGDAQAARDFCAVPGCLPSGLHCFRPDLGFWQAGTTAQGVGGVTGCGSSGGAAEQRGLVGGKGQRRGVVGLCSWERPARSLPSPDVAASSTHGDSSQPPLLHWPLLCCASGSRQEGGRPSVALKLHLPATSPPVTVGHGSLSSPAAPPPVHNYASLVGAHGNGADGGLGAGTGARKAPHNAVRVSLDLLGMTVWLSEGAMGRLTAAANELSSGLTQSGVSQSPVGHPVSAAMPLSSPGAGAAGALAGLPTGVPASPASAKRAAVQAVINDILTSPGDNQQQGPSSLSARATSIPPPATSQRAAAAAGAAADAAAAWQQLNPKPRQPLPEMELTVSAPHICIIAALPAPPQPPPNSSFATAAAASSESSSVRTHSASITGGGGTPAPAAPATTAATSASANSVPPSLVFAVLDVLSTTHHDHVAHHRMQPHRGLPFVR